MFKQKRNLLHDAIMKVEPFEKLNNSNNQLVLSLFVILYFFLCYTQMQSPCFISLNSISPDAVIVGVEMVGPKKREMSGVLLNYFYSVGEALVGLLFWLYPNWIVLQLLVSVPPLLFIGYYWIVPESVRWLLARKDYTQAKKIISKAARINGVQLSDHIMQSFELKSPTHTANVINILHYFFYFLLYCNWCCCCCYTIFGNFETKYKQSNH